MPLMGADSSRRAGRRLGEAGGCTPRSLESLGGGQGHALSLLEEEAPVGCSGASILCSPDYCGRAQMQRGLCPRSGSEDLAACALLTDCRSPSQEGEVRAQTLASLSFTLVSRGWLESVRSWKGKGSYWSL